MFAYCGNNPVIAADYNGKWFNLVIGAVAGALVSGVSTALQGGSTDEIILSSVMGGLSGLIGASGLGGLVGQVVAGAFTSAVDSGYQNYNAYVAGEKTLAEAVVSTVADTALGAAFGAMGFEGETLNATDALADTTLTAAKTLFSKGIHPAVKATARSAVKKGIKYIVNESASEVINNCIGSGISFATSELIGVIY